MAIQTSDLLQRLSPTGYLSGGRGDRPDSSMERERLRLMREQFENTKQQQAQAAELARLEEQGRMARAQLQHQGQMAQLDAQQAAATKAKRLEAYQKFTELNGSGDIEGARAMVPMMTALGMGVDLEGEDGGLPRYRVEMDAAEAEQKEAARTAKASPYGANETAEQSLSRMGAIGDADETGAIEKPMGVTRSDDVDSSGLTVGERVASTYGEPGEKTPMAAPAEPDYTGGVPKNVLDMGAINSAAAARLNPALSGIIGGLPERYQANARSTASGIGGLGLPAAKAVEMFGKQQGDANALIKGEFDAEREQLKASYAARFGSDKEGVDRFKVGFDTLGKEVGNQYDIEARKRQRVLNARLGEILNNTVKEDDMLVLGGIVRGLGEVGAPSNADAARALGLPATSTWDQIADWITSRTEGGMPESARKALANVVKNNIIANDAEFVAFADAMDELADAPDTDPDVGRGVKAYARAVLPRDIRDAREAKRKAQTGRANSQAATAALDGSELDYALDLEASAANLNTAAIKRVIQLESGGKPDAVNPTSGATGLIQFMPDTAKALGTTTEELAKMPVEDQVRFVVKYFENAGINENSTPDDYALAVAAPAFVGKPDDTVVYEKGSKAWEQNKPWRPPGGGDITVGSIKAAYTDKGKSEEPSTPQDADARRARLAELRKKYGR